MTLYLMFTWSGFIPVIC